MKITIIVPVYNVEKYIERCSKSLFEQSYEDIEYIFINDCSTDKSILVLEDIISQYPYRKSQIRIINNSTNRGSAYVRKLGINLSNGDYIINCDSDDWVDKDYIKKLVKQVQIQNADIVVCDYYRTDGNYYKRYTSVNGSISKDNYLRNLIAGYNSTAVWNKLIRTSLLHEEKFKYPVANMWEDFVITVQCAYFAKKIAYIEEPLYYYYQNPTSICNSLSLKNKINEIINNSSIILNFLHEHDLSDKYANEIVLLKYYARSELSLYVNDKKIRNLWSSIYPEIENQILNIQNFDNRERIKYISIKTGIYPNIIKCKNFVSKIMKFSSK